MQENERGGGFQQIGATEETTWPDSESSETTPKETTPPPRTLTRNCLECGAEYETPGHQFMGRDFSQKYCEPCREAREAVHLQEEFGQVELAKQRVRDSWRRTSKIPPRFAGETFALWEERGWRKHAAFKAVKAWAENFPENAVGYPSLILYSADPGHGKTTLAICAANHLIDRWDGDPEEPRRAPVRYETGPGLGVRIRASYNLNERSEGIEERDVRETEADIYQYFQGPPLLILDDVGDPRKEPATEHTSRVYFHIVNERYSHNVPILLITNSRGSHLEDLMGRYTVDRIHEMANGQWLAVPGRTRTQRVASDA